MPSPGVSIITSPGLPSVGGITLVIADVIGTDPLCGRSVIT